MGIQKPARARSTKGRCLLQKRLMKPGDLEAELASQVANGTRRADKPRSGRTNGGRLVTILATFGLLSALVVPTAVLANHPGGPTTTEMVAPTFEAGNPSCASIGSEAEVSFKINAPETGTFTDPTTGIVFTITSPSTLPGEGSGPSFDFSASGGVVLEMIVKGGPNANLYDYGTGVSSDTFLHAPVNHGNGRFYGLSHLEICYNPGSTTTTVTEIHLDGTHAPVANGAELPLGSSVHDKATVTGDAPSGSVVFTFFRGGDCETGTEEAAGTVALAAVDATTSVAHPSDSKTALAPGNYAFQAEYLGDSNNDGSTSACEPFSVDKGDLTITTEIHLGNDHDTNVDRAVNPTASVPINSVVHDVSLVTGAVTGFAPTGAITFTMWNNGNCSGTGAALATDGNDGVSSNVRSVDTSALSPGDYSFMATIAGDTNYNGDTSPCEILKVDLNAPTLSTAPWVYPNDSATITGLVDPQPGSTLTFTAYTDSDCAGDVLLTQQFTNIVNDTYDTTNTSTVVDFDTTVFWVVEYSGDANNSPAASDCVEQIDLTFVTDPPPAP